MRRMNHKPYIPHPFQFLMLFIVWLLLTHRYSLGNMLLAAILAWLVPIAAMAIRAPTTPVRRPLKAISFFWLLLGDIFVSNIVVAKQVLGATERLRPGFIAVPLDMQAALPITLLASTISLTPGTVSIEITEDHQFLYVHALHVESEKEMVDRIKRRYEKPLKEIFQC
ncbi:MAG: Na+/H+ antiporter subunit E [Desulfosarcinaceae bacterium]|nr:Na+/H+ antiporter subunit E [Desulfosarcinaceae bacterium]